MHKDFEHQAQRVDQEGAFASLHFLAAIVAAGPAGMWGLYGLSIENRRGGLCVASGRYTHAFSQTTVDLLPETGPTPLPEVIIDGLPLRQIMGQQAPRNTAPQHIQHRIDDGTHLLPARSP